MVQQKYDRSHYKYLYTYLCLSVCRIYTPFHPEVGDSTAKTIGDTLLNALIILVVIVVMTTVLVLLYKYKFYKVGTV